MKKSIVILLGILCCFLLVACSDTPEYDLKPPLLNPAVVKSSEEKNPIKPSFSFKDLENVDKYLKTTQLKEFISKEPLEEKKEQQWAHRWYVTTSNSIEVGTKLTLADKELTLGVTTLDECENMGFDLDSYVDEVQPNESSSVILRKNKQHFIVQTKINTDRLPKPLGECVIDTFTSGNITHTLPFCYENVTEKVTLPQLIDIFGLPNYSVATVTTGETKTFELTYIVKNTEGSPKLFTISFLFDEAVNQPVFNMAQLSEF